MFDNVIKCCVLNGKYAYNFLFHFALNLEISNAINKSQIIKVKIRNYVGFILDEYEVHEYLNLCNLLILFLCKFFHKVNSQ